MAGNLNMVTETLANSVQLQPERLPTPSPSPMPWPVPSPSAYGAFSLRIQSIAYRSLVSAVANNNLQQVLEALRHGADVNEPLNFGESPILTFSIGGGDVEIVKTLLAAGADVNRTTRCSDTALCCAIAKRYPEIVKVLLEAGADINIVTADDLTPLSLASRMGNVEIVKMLIGAGADVNATDKDGKTALLEASCRGKTEIVKMLIEAGADANAKDNNGQIAFDVAHSPLIENCSSLDTDTDIHSDPSGGLSSAAMVGMGVVGVVGAIVTNGLYRFGFLSSKRVRGDEEQGLPLNDGENPGSPATYGATNHS
jgi:ankyrin repeat protein